MTTGARSGNGTLDTVDTNWRIRGHPPDPVDNLSTREIPYARHSHRGEGRTHGKAEISIRMPCSPNVRILCGPGPSCRIVPEYLNGLTKHAEIAENNKTSQFTSQSRGGKGKGGTLLEVGTRRSTVDGTELIHC
jgi:hypothetical protein